VHPFFLEAPFGLLGGEVSSRGLSRLYFLERRIPGASSSYVAGPDGGTATSEAGEDGGSPEERELVREVSRQLVEYFDGQRHDFDLPLDIAEGSPFRRRVWQAIAEIPYGRTASYAEVAAAAGAPAAFRAAGSACGANPITVVIPCHRVVAAGHRLGGFGGSIATKIWLLRHEGARVLIPEGARQLELSTIGV
jgi:methylated-DNA-[protein]-cysteine S-methyltransferase